MTCETRVLARHPLLLLAVCSGLLIVAGWLASPVQAAPSGNVAARDRDEDLRVERFLPPAAAVAGLAGVALAARLRERRLGRIVRVGAPLLALAFALGPVVAIGPRPLNRQPSPDAQEYADAAHHLAVGEGYVVTVRRGEVQPPRYPPGFSLALAPFALVGSYPANVQLGSKLLVVLYLVVTLVTAWVVAGPLAAAVAVGLVGASPFAVRYASLVMSDAFGAALAVGVLALIHGAHRAQPTPDAQHAQRASVARLAGAGLLTGALVLVRLSGILTAAALVPALWRATSWRRRMVAGAGVVLGVLLVAGQQWWTFGSPLKTGYHYYLSDIDQFRLDYPFAADVRRDGSGVVADSLDGALLAWACPCPEDDPLMAFRGPIFYPLVLLGIFWILVPPLTTVPGLIEVWRRRSEPGPAYVLWLTVLTVVFHLFYWYLGARFMAAPATLLAIYTGAWVARWAEGGFGRADEPRADERPSAGRTGAPEVRARAAGIGST
jgi:hypothetical protein